MIFILLIALLLLLSLVDEKTLTVPEGLSLLAVLIGLDVHAATGTANMAIIGLTVGVMSVWVLNQTPVIKLGGGDAKVIGFIGAWLGWQVALETLAISVILYKAFFSARKQKAFVPIIFEGFLIVSIGVLLCHLVKLL